MRALAFGALLAALVGGCGGDGGGSAPEMRPTDELVSALCDAADAAAAGDGDDARAAFDDLHSDLHVLASAAGDRDRQAAGELLRAKRRVEESIGGEAGQGLADDLERLAVATAAAGRAGSGSCD